MSARNQPFEQVGAVSIYAPAAGGTNGYFRLKWIEPDGSRGDTTAGRQLEQARAKAAAIAIRLSRAASPFAVVTVQDIVNAYLAQGRSPYKSKAAWQKTQKDQLRRSLARCIAGDEHLQAMDITREVLDRMRSRGGTDNMVRAYTTALRGLLRWGYQAAERYFSPEQAELLPRAGVCPAPDSPSTVRPHREASVRRSGDGLDFISTEDAPSAPLTVSLGAALQQCYPSWGRLSVEVAANVGLRWGEQFQLTAYDIHLDGCAERKFAHVHINFQIDAGAKAGPRESRLTLPKGKKRRVVPIALTSFTGYSLREAVRARRAAALAEQAAGKNADALMFPSVTGLMLWHSAFSDVVRPAMRTVGWPFREWLDDGGKVHFVHDLVWHSLRHRFARICVDDRNLKPGQLMAIGGWENLDTVTQRYYKSGDDNINGAAEHFED
jgi:integrase